MESTTDLLKTIDYSDKSFVVFGEATRTFKEQLKALGGRFNGRLGVREGFPGGAGWIYPSTTKETVLKFVAEANAGQWSPGSLPNETTTSSQLPQVIVPQKNTTYQTIKWRVFKPVIGMHVSISGDLKGEVIQTETHKDVVDTAYISVNGNTSKVEISNGRWQVRGYLPEHTVKFE